MVFGHLTQVQILYVCVRARFSVQTYQSNRRLFLTFILEWQMCHFPVSSCRMTTSYGRRFPTFFSSGEIDIWVTCAHVASICLLSFANYISQYFPLKTFQSAKPRNWFRFHLLTVLDFYLLIELFTFVIDKFVLREKVLGDIILHLLFSSSAIRNMFYSWEWNQTKEWFFGYEPRTDQNFILYMSVF